jgi:hypothetical protein
MYTAIIRLLGTDLTIRYQPHENYMEWRMVHEHSVPSQMEHEFLDSLLRIHYTTFIEGALREHYHWKMEEESRGIDPNSPPF